MGEKNCCVCKKNLINNKFVVLKNTTYVCHSCIVTISDINTQLKQIVFDEDDFFLKEESKEFQFNKPEYLRPKQIKKILDQYIVGQELAKKILSVASYNHYKRTTINEEGIKKSNIMLIGPTGSGKTYLIETLSRILDVPLAITPATSLTEAGYIGDDVESCIQRLLEKAGGDVSRAEHGIVFIDEIDKLTISSSETKRQVGGKGVQQALLSLLEGTKVLVSLQIGDHSFNGGEVPKVEVDTRNILFICGGAFPDAEKVIKKRLGRQTNIGFGARENTSEFDESYIFSKINHDDLKECGLIPELLGRFPVIAPFENLCVDLLKRILIEPRNSIILEYQKIFQYDSVHLKFDDEALQAIAEKAIERGTGARSLRSILEELLLDFMYETPSDIGVKELHITKAYVNGIGNHLIFYDRAITQSS